MNFVCPKCRSPLAVFCGVAKCQMGHAYDRAKAGYFNLLLSASGGTHGDNREMVEARRDFLDTGAYFPLAKKVTELLRTHLSGNKVLDIGCGEGYYTDAIVSSLADMGIELSAFDISKEAVKHAARRNKNVDLAVASAYKMPTADESFDGAVNMFSPLVREEVLRTLKKGGVFILAVPGEEHLFGLKRAAYKTPYKNELDNPEIEGFSLIQTERLTYELELNNQKDVSSLFMMTPYAYRTPPEDKMRVLSLQKLKTAVDFVIFVYKKV